MSAWTGTVAFDTGWLAGGGDHRFEVVKRVGDLAGQPLDVLLDDGDLVEQAGEDAPVVDPLGQLALLKICGSGANGEISFALPGGGLAQEVARAGDVVVNQLVEGFVERETLAELLDLISPMVRSVCSGVLVWWNRTNRAYAAGSPSALVDAAHCAVGRLSRARGWRPARWADWWRKAASRKVTGVYHAVRSLPRSFERRARTLQ